MPIRTKLAIAAFVLALASFTVPSSARATGEENNRCYDDPGTGSEYHDWGSIGTCLTGKILDFPPEAGSRCNTHMVEGHLAHNACGS